MKLQVRYYLQQAGITILEAEDKGGSSNVDGLLLELRGGQKLLNIACTDTKRNLLKLGGTFTPKKWWGPRDGGHPTRGGQTSTPSPPPGRSRKGIPFLHSALIAAKVGAMATEERRSFCNEKI